MFEKLKDIVNNHESGGDNVDSLQSFLGEVFKGSGNERSNGFENLCEKLKALFGDNNIKSGMTNTDKHIDLKSLNNAVTDQAKKLKPSRFTNSTAKALAAGVKGAATAFLAELQTKAYTSFYKGADNKDVGNDQCAKIFLGCLPLYYQAFTYIYWRCDSSGNGEWETQTFDGSKGHHLKYFMFAMNYETSYLNNRRGSEVLSGAIKSFADFKEGMTAAAGTAGQRASAVSKAFNKLYPSVSSHTSNQKPTYPEFLAELHKKFTETIKNPQTQGNSLAALYYCALFYFKCQQQKNVTKAVKIPSTIREMLYYLAAFPFSPNYDAFNTYVTDHFKKLSKSESDEVYDAALMIPVADSGISTEATVKSGGNTVSAADIKDYLTETCMYSMSALGWLHGPGASKNTEEPWLHELFCNTQFNLGYSSGQAILNTLSNCTYALQFQLSFLFSTCGNIGLKCGWQECTYGKEMNPNGSGNPFLTSHICPGLKCGSPGRCKHNFGPCNHNNYSQSEGCGKGSNPSPSRPLLLGRFRHLALALPPLLTTCPTTLKARCAIPRWAFRQTI